MKSVFDPSSQHYDVDSKIVVALERISEAFRVILWKENKKHNLSPIQLKFLIFFFFRPSDQRTVSRLSQEFDLTKATVSDAIRTMEEKKLLYRKKSSIDKRISIISLTEKGKKTAKEGAFFGNEIKDQLSSINDDDKINLMTSLMDIIKELQKKGYISIARMCITCKYFEQKQGKKNHFYCHLLNQSLKKNKLRINCFDYDNKKESVSI